MTIRWHRFHSARIQGGWWADLGPATEPVAEAHKTGTHLDDYPWDWYLVGDAKPIAGRHQSGVADTLRSAKSNVAYALGIET